MVINKKISIRNRTVLSNKTNKYIVIHYVGAVSTAVNNAKYFYSVYRGASAHYFTDDTSIWQAVLDKNAAWQCGGGSQGSGGKKFFGKCKNSNSIGIEMCCKKKNGKLYITDATIANTAKLVKYLMKKYNIPAANVIRHYDVTGKNCPAPFIDEAKWKKLHATLTGTSTSSTTTKTPAKTSTVSEVTVDGKWDKSTTKASQKILKTPVDGIVSNQVSANKKYLPAVDTASWQFKKSGYKDGSSMVKALQKLTGVTADGLMGKKSVIALQKFLNKKGFNCGEVDGSMGTKTVKAWQKYVNSKL